MWTKIISDRKSDGTKKQADGDRKLLALSREHQRKEKESSKKKRRTDVRQTDSTRIEEKD